ncbi:MAG TPA: AraC family transcriptional regulator [Gammaproteobacteria bacterium]
MPFARDLLCLLHEIRHAPDGDASLAALARRSGWSPFHLHREFRRTVNETPKRYVLRLRLERAAARLAAGNEKILWIALSEGFRSHEVFSRAFQRHFGCTPKAYRARALRGATAEERSRHRALIEATGPCITLFHFPTTTSPRRTTMPTLNIEKRTIDAQAVLYCRRRCTRAELPAAIGEGLGLVYGHVQKAGLPISGKPFVRYTDMTPGSLAIECGCPLASPAADAGDVQAGYLHGGDVCVALHAGPYEQLHETYAAMEKWMAAHGRSPGGAPWESYLTDPGEHPNPADWRTEVYWPLATER